MSKFTAWAKKRGWWQTERPSFWRSGPLEEYAGLEKGYWTIVMISQRLIGVTILFSPSQKENWLKAASFLKERQKNLSRQGINYNAECIRRNSFVFWFCNPRTEKVEESLQKLLNLLSEASVGSNPSCTACGEKDHLNCYKVTHTNLPPYLLCPTCVEKLQNSISSGMYRYPRKAALVQAELL